VAHWLRGTLGDEIMDMSGSLVGTMVDAEMVARLLNEHRSGAVDHSQPLWLVYSYLLWRESL
jgi:asparagine synthase (glutamine-hydrolysing)